MDKTLRLLELDFTENQVSLAIDKFGPEVPIAEIADWLCRGQFADLSWETTEGLDGACKHEVKLEKSVQGSAFHTIGMNMDDIFRKKPDKMFRDSSSSLRWM
ncbi:hypothetical protein Droror1_Dr00023883 [Drosera rotundifolia]